MEHPIWIFFLYFKQYKLVYSRGGKYQAKVLKSPIQSGRQEGKVVCLLPNPENASHGFIEVTETGRENVFFHQRESEITASDMKRISVGTKVQFSIARNRSGDRYIAKNLYIQASAIDFHYSMSRLFSTCGVQLYYLVWELVRISCKLYVFTLYLCSDVEYAVTRC